MEPRKHTRTLGRPSKETRIYIRKHTNRTDPAPLKRNAAIRKHAWATRASNDKKSGTESSSASKQNHRPNPHQNPGSQKARAADAHREHGLPNLWTQATPKSGASVAKKTVVQDQANNKPGRQNPLSVQTRPGQPSPSLLGWSVLPDKLSEFYCPVASSMRSHGQRCWSIVQSLSCDRQHWLIYCWPWPKVEDAHSCALATP